MSNKSRQLYWMRAESFVHVGAGQQAGLIDLPFAREGAHGYPYIPGSGMKGGLREAMRMVDEPNGDGNDGVQTNRLFGSAESAGQILISDARLAFLPVRALDTSYRYVTSPGLLRRLVRDWSFAAGGVAAASAGTNVSWAELDHESRAFGVWLGNAAANDTVFLEEFRFDLPPKVDSLRKTLSDLLDKLPDEIRSEVKARCVLISDRHFDYFARHGLHVRMRNRLDPASKTVGNGLWNEESLPPDTVMYFVASERQPYRTARGDEGAPLEDLEETLQSLGRFVQVGGNETVGEGWFSIWKDASSDDGNE